MAHRGMKFGIFLAPFHRVGENPTLAINRDVELLEWLDWLGYDEAWIGEHHSAGWELIALPELIIAAAAERTKHIRLGTGVTSLPYHHPFMVAQRFVQLDHMTRGRAMMGCGPGALTSDAYMLGIEPQHAASAHAGGDGRHHAAAEMRRAGHHEDRLVRDARRAPASRAVHRSAFRDRGGQHDHAVRHDRRRNARRRRAVDRRRPAGRAGGAGAASGRSPRTTAAKHGKTMDRKNWRVVVNAHIAEDDEQALREVKKGERIETQTYFEDTLGRPPGRADDPLRDGVKMGTTLVGSPETVTKGISRLLEYSQGGFGGILFRAHEWANREQTLRSYELFARYVMPQFQGSLNMIAGSNTWARENRKQVFGSTVEAVRRAFTDFGRAAPEEEIRARTLGARDIDPPR